jgi:hypothetical protein
MTIKTFVPGVNTQFSTDLNGNFASAYRAAGLTTIRQLIDRDIDFSAGQTDCFADAYVDADGREGTVVPIATFAGFNTNKYSANDFVNGPFVIIEATSISSESDFAINDCEIKSISSGKWALYCNTGTNAVRRAQIYRTLFDGSSGTNPRVQTPYIVGLTALKTSVSRDVGKRAYKVTQVNNNNFDFDVDVTFANTSTNTNFSSWSNLNTNVGSTSGSFSWQVPTGTTRNSATTTASDEIGTDTESEEVNNPTTGKLVLSTTQNGSVTQRLMVISNGAVTFTPTATGVNATTTVVDFTTTHSVPTFTATSETLENTITHVIPFGRLSSSTSSAILIPFVQDWEDGADIKYKLQSSQLLTGETIHNPQSFTNSSNAFDGSSATSTGSVSLTVDTHLGKTFATSKYITTVSFESTLSGSSSGTYVSVQYYNGTSWIDTGALAILTGAGVISYSKSLFVSCLGIRVKYTAAAGHSVTFQEIVATETFEDSGWLNCIPTGDTKVKGVASSFTGFTQYPGVLTIKLIPKSSSPTAGFPSLRGFALYTE